VVKRKGINNSPLLYKYVGEHFLVVHKHLADFKRTKNTECLHHLRVSIKKIRAILSFLEYTHQRSFNIYKLKILFSEAGKIREMNINIDLLNGLAGFPQEIIKILKKREIVLIQKFLKKINRYKLDLQTIRTRIKLPKELPNKKTIRHYFNQETARASNKLRSKNRKDMHAFRKVLKRIKYVLDLLPKEYQQLTGLKTSNIDQIQDRVGIWHDTYSLIGFMNELELGDDHSKFIAGVEKKEKALFNKILDVKFKITT